MQKEEGKIHLAGLDLLPECLNPGLKFGRSCCERCSCRLPLTLQLGRAGCQGSLSLGALGYGLVLQIAAVLCRSIGARLGLSCCDCKPNEGCAWILGGDAIRCLYAVGAIREVGTLARQGVM